MAYIFSDINTGDNSIVIVGGANMDFGPEREYDLGQNWVNTIQQSNILLLQREIPEKVNIAAAQAAKDAENSVLVVLDMGGNDTPISPKLISLCDIISPN